MKELNIESNNNVSPETNRIVADFDLIGNNNQAPGLADFDTVDNNAKIGRTVIQKDPREHEFFGLLDLPEDHIEVLQWVVDNLRRSPMPECPTEADYYGKNPKAPHFLNYEKHPVQVQWEPWQTRIPPKELLIKWFQHTKGIGMLCGFNGMHWIVGVDIDKKTFENDDCDEVVKNWEERYPVLTDCPMFRTPSGGYRHLIAVRNEPINFKSNSGFSLKPDGSHCGELLAKNGAHTVLPPTIGLKGAYTWVRFANYPPVIENIEDIGIYPVKKQQGQKKEKHQLAKKTESKEPNSTTNSEFENNFDDVIAEVNKKLDFETAFDWEGHNFQYDGDKVRGCCPWHDSSSGTAFYAQRNDNGILLWRCAGCDVGGDIFDYRSRLEGGGGKPRGKEFTEILKKYCEETGVTFPDRSRQNFDKAPVKDEDPWQMKTSIEETILKALFEEGKGNFTVVAKTYYEYAGDNKGYWKALKDEDVERLISHALQKVFELKKQGDEQIKKYRFATENNKSAAYKFCRSHLGKSQEIYNTHLVAFNNCTVDLRTGEQYSHKRDNFCFFSIPTTYNPGAECPKIFAKFIEDSYGSNYFNLIRAVVSMFLDPTAPYGYFLHLMGESGSGKGVLLRLLSSFLGDDGVRQLSSLEDINTPESRHQYLTGVRLVTIPDTGGRQGGLRAFYELVDNGGMAGRPLYSSQSYQKIWNTRFALASVSHLSIENSGDGWDRRCIPIPTKRRRCAADPTLLTKLELEKGDIISWALGMDRAERDYLIMNSTTVSSEIAELKREQSIQSDSVKAFIDMCLRPSTNEKLGISKAYLHDFYSAYCKVHGYQPWAYNRFIGHLKQVLSQNYVARKYRRVDGKLQPVPDHFAFIKTLPDIFKRLDDNTFVFKKEDCLDGGLDEFEQFWQEPLSTQIVADTGLDTEENQPCVNPVSATIQTQQAIRDNFEKSETLNLCQPCVSYNPDTASNSSLENSLTQVTQGKNTKTITREVNSTKTTNDIIIGGVVNREEESFPDQTCVTCVSSCDPDTVTVVADTGLQNQTCVNPVSVPQPCVSSTEESESLTDAAKAISNYVLTDPQSTQADAQETLMLFGVNSWQDLHDYLTVEEFKKLEMVMRKTPEYLKFEALIQELGEPF